MYWIKSWFATGLPSLVFHPRLRQPGIHLEKTARKRRSAVSDCVVVTCQALIDETRPRSCTRNHCKS